MCSEQNFQGLSGVKFMDPHRWNGYFRTVAQYKSHDFAKSFVELVVQLDKRLRAPGLSCLSHRKQKLLPRKAASEALPEDS
jgi:hypothetical protein